MKVVDTQVMLHRATDFAKETSVHLKRNDVAQQFLKDQGQHEALRKVSEVQVTDESQAQQAIHRDGRGQSSGARDKQGKRDRAAVENDPILDGSNPLLAEMSLETSDRYVIKKPRIDIDI